MKENTDTTNPSTPPVHKSYKCSNCGAPVNYVPGNKLLYCEYCKTYSKITQEEKTKKSTSKKKRLAEHASTVVCCHKCVATYESERYPNDKSCLFCGEPVYYEDLRERYVVQPIGLIPFGITEQQFVENVKKMAGKTKLPSPFSTHGVSDLRINQFYLPCWVSTLSSPTDREQLSNPRFAYKKKFFEAKNYLGSNFFEGKDVLSTLGPFDRLSIIPIRDKDIGSAKVMAFTLPIADGGYIEDALSKIKERHVFLSSIGEDNKTKEWDVVLLPIYECSYTYKLEKYVIYGNGQTGNVCAGPKTEVILKKKKKDSITMKVIAAVIALFVLISMISVVQNRMEWKKEWGSEKQEQFIASYTAFDGVNSPADQGKVLPKIDRNPIGQLTQSSKRSWDISYKLHKMKYGENEYVILIDDSPKDLLSTYWVMDGADFENLKAIKDKEPIVIWFRVYAKGYITNGYSTSRNFEKLAEDIASNRINRSDDTYALLDLIVCVDKEADKAVFKLKDASHVLFNGRRLTHQSEHRGVDELDTYPHEVPYSAFSKFFQIP